MAMHTQTTDPTGTIVKVLMATEDMGQGDLSRSTGISEATISRRFKNGKWRSDELVRIAKHFEVPIETLYADPSGVRDALRGLPPGRGFGCIYDQPSLFDFVPRTDDGRFN